jgi:hypothetical protein
VYFSECNEYFVFRRKKSQKMRPTYIYIHMCSSVFYWNTLCLCTYVHRYYRKNKSICLHTCLVSLDYQTKRRFPTQSYLNILSNRSQSLTSWHLKISATKKSSRRVQASQSKAEFSGKQELTRYGFCKNQKYINMYFISKSI